MVHVHVEPHADRIGRHDMIDLSGLIHRHLCVACSGGKRAQHDRTTTTLTPQRLSQFVNTRRRKRDHRAAWRQARDLAKARGGAPEASIWFDPGPKLPLVSAARVNAMMSDAAASDDSDLRNIVHAGTPLTAVSLAVAERTGASGKDILAAIVTGYEAAGRIGEAISPTFNPHGHHGCKGAVFGGTIAASRLLKLNTEQITVIASLFVP